MRTTWSGRVQTVYERSNDQPELLLYLEDAFGYSDTDPALPRAGERFWLIDDATFERLKEQIYA